MSATKINHDTLQKYPNMLQEWIKRRHYKVTYLANKTNIPRRTLWDYIAGRVPLPEDRLSLLAEALECSPEQLLPTFSLWNIPFQRNPFFMGRDVLLQQIHTLFHTEGTVALNRPLALCGLGGIGKTQAAIEYAYRYREAYDAILWVRADTKENILADFLSLAILLNLIEQDAHTPYAFPAIMQWLQSHTKWLLLFDNAGDLLIVREFLPPTFKGHILFTTRAQSTGGFAQSIDIEIMTPEVGALFLLRRASLLASDDSIERVSLNDRKTALDIAYVLGGLPLALDQAGAYIEECSYHLEGYLRLYQEERGILLKRRGGLVMDHPEPVTATWILSFQQVEWSDSVAADLLRLCAFLDPDAIPEELLLEGLRVCGLSLTSVSQEQLRMNEALEVVLRFSLLQRNAEKRTVTIHRLVQATLQENMNEEVQSRWAQQVVSLVNHAFPNARFFVNWEVCQRYLPHARRCAELIEQLTIHSTEAMQLLNKTGYYLMRRGMYADAAIFYQQAEMNEKQFLQNENETVAETLYRSAELYYMQGKYTEAEPLYQQALTIRERVWGMEHPSVALSLHNLGLLYYEQGKYTETEEMYIRALSIWEKALGEEHPDVAECLTNLAGLYRTQKRNAEVEALLRRALVIREKTLGKENPDLVLSLYFLAKFYLERGNDDIAEQLLQKGLLMCESVLGLEHPYRALHLNDLGYIASRQGKYQDAEAFYVLSLEINENVLGSEHPDIVSVLENYAALLHSTKREREAASLERRIRAIQAKHVAS